MPFVLAIALSAFLLFTLELLAGRLLLPVFGGSPAVWTTALVFFTGILLCGYLYAHVAATRLSRANGMRLQLALVALAIILTALSPADVATTRVREVAEAINVLLALGVLVGPAALLLATTTPLVSAWYASLGRDPWWLYAASNAASFAALLCYPLLIQPLIGLSAQRGLLVVGLVGYGGLVATIALNTRRARNVVAPEETSSAREEATNDAPPASRAQPLSIKRQGIWLLASAVPAGLLAATTNFIQTDLVSAPLIWIGPLAAYLASFVVAFSPRAGRLRRWSENLVPGAAMLLLVPFVIPVGWPVVPLVVTELACLFVLAVAIHGRLYGDRPDERQLTRFYLILSAGGVVGTAFVALIAPLVFNGIYEYPLLVVAAPLALATLPALARDEAGQRRRLLAIRPLAARLVPFAAAALLLAGVLFIQQSETGPAVAGLFVAAAALVALSVRPGLTAVACAAFILLLIGATYTNPIHRERSFFGVLEVRGSDVEHSFYSGTTLHGLQFLDHRRTMATAYFIPTGPLGDCFADLRARTGPDGARFAVVGLGAGVMATYIQPGDEVTFIEIDAAGARIAQDPAYFTFLADPPVQPRIVIGDGRLELAAMPTQSFDLLILDAFTSDTVPAHLLTAEAIQTYLTVLRPGGVVCLHLSNRYYDLPPSLATTARSIGLDALKKVGRPTPQEETELGAQVSYWLVVGQPADVPRFESAGWTRSEPGLVLTDDFSDLTRLLFEGGPEP